MNAPYQQYAQTVSRAEPEARAQFIRKTYSHLAAALLVFAGLTGLMINSPVGVKITQMMLGGKYSWLIVMGWLYGGLLDCQ